MLSLVSLALVLPATAWLPPTTLVDRRAVIGGAAAAALMPMPAFARSKEKARQMAIQKETAAEARQAMKEYKFAPRPVLEGNAETGYKFKDGTVKSGANGEMASYFKVKGEELQKERIQTKVKMGYDASRLRSVDTIGKSNNVGKSTPASSDEAKIKEALKRFEGQKDEMGRLIM